MYTDIPLVGTWCDYFRMGGLDTEVRIQEIYGLKWNSKKGSLIISCRLDYYINEYHEDFKRPDKKSELTLIK